MSIRKVDKYKTLTKVFKKMCSIAGHDYDKIDFKDTNDPYYLKYTWTVDNELEFINWFSGVILRNKEYRELFKFPRLLKSKDASLEAAQWFNFNYGFKVDR